MQFQFELGEAMAPAWDGAVVFIGGGPSFERLKRCELRKQQGRGDEECEWYCQLNAKLKELQAEMRRRWHQPVADTGRWLRSVVQGHFNYYAVPGNLDSLNSFRAQVIWRWYRALRRRSQRGQMTLDRVWRLVVRWIPLA